MTPKALLFAAPLALLLGACATVPTGPSVMVLPGTAKPFDQFQADDMACRQWALHAAGITTKKAATNTMVTGAAVGTAVGAAAGGLMGGSGGAAVGAGVGLVGGSVVGADAGNASGHSLQQRYDFAFQQCMYAKGHQVPVARGSVPRQSYSTSTPPPPRYSSSTPPPPPPAGTPPAPPSGYRVN